MTTRRGFLGVLGGLAAAVTLRGRKEPEKIVPKPTPCLPVSEVHRANGTIWVTVTHGCEANSLVDVKMIAYREEA